MPKPIFRTKHHLLAWLYENLRYHAVRRAMDEGKIKNLGWFSEVSGSRYPGWIVQIESRSGRMYYVAVISDNDLLENRAYDLFSLAGCKYQGGESELYKGDL
jgi:hypothetical protein